MTGDIPPTLDGHRDAIALMRCRLARDPEGVLVILENCHRAATFQALCDMFLHAVRTISDGDEAEWFDSMSNQVEQAFADHLGENEERRES